ncbi:hypothetical protein GCM10008967_00470 [Bacillus carboniphilus]|uniref:Lipoprotein n=1 Tax=Bacillus carboniphilus TaxID=86663 RepID=A0ABN0VPB4_9BACI
MKKVALLILATLFLAGCSKEASLIHDDFKKDTDQIVELIEGAKAEKRELTEEELNLHEKFHKKYIAGSFSDGSGNSYEMNDLEKGIVRKIDDLIFFLDENVGLASEESNYDKVKKQLHEYMEADSIPESLVGKYPTYVKYDGIHPQFKEDTLTLIEIFDDIMLTNNNGVGQWEIDKLEDYTSKYLGEGFESDGEHILMNEEMHNIYMVFFSLKYDLKESKLFNHTIEEYKEVRDLLQN